MLAPPITVRRIAATPRVRPRSMPCTAMWSGTVIRVGKKRNWAAQRVQKTRLLRISAKPPPRPAGTGAAPDAAARSGGGRRIDAAATSSNSARRDPERKSRPAPAEDRRMRRAATGGSTICPVAVPTFAIPVIIPRRRANQRAMVERVATSWVLIPTPMKSPKSTKRCQGSPTTEMRAKPVPKSRPAPTSTGAGPKRSQSRPAKTASRPMTRAASATALERRVRDQPNSSSRTLKKTPNEKRSPITVNWVRHAPKTMRYRESIALPFQLCPVPAPVPICPFRPQTVRRRPAPCMAISRASEGERPGGRIDGARASPPALPRRRRNATLDLDLRPDRHDIVDTGQLPDRHDRDGRDVHRRHPPYRIRIDSDRSNPIAPGHIQTHSNCPAPPEAPNGKTQ